MNRKPKKSFAELSNASNLLNNLRSKHEMFTQTLAELNALPELDAEQLIWVAWAGQRIKQLEKEIQQESAL
jgi:hypothetical protein